MKALILAAGIGKRLKPITDSIPKTLIQVEDKPILGHILSNIKACDIKNVVIVTGYRKKLIEDYVGNGSKWGLRVNYCHNRWFKETENILSIKLASDYLIGDEFVLINSDDLFSPMILWKLIQADGDIVLAIDRGGSIGSEEMKVSVDENGRIVGISKELDPKESFGEDIGIAKFSIEGGKVFFEAVDEIIQSRGPYFYFQEALNYLASQNYPMSYVTIEDEPWVEIDDHFDLKWAKTPIIYMILDRIKSIGSKIKSMKEKIKLK